MIFQSGLVISFKQIFRKVFDQVFENELADLGSSLGVFVLSN